MKFRQSPNERKLVDLDTAQKHFKSDVTAIQTVLDGSDERFKLSTGVTVECDMRELSTGIARLIFHGKRPHLARYLSDTLLSKLFRRVQDWQPVQTRSWQSADLPIRKIHHPTQNIAVVTFQRDVR
jgi:hypothetical protein